MKRKPYTSSAWQYTPTCYDSSVASMYCGSPFSGLEIRRLSLIGRNRQKKIPQHEPHATYKPHTSHKQATHMPHTSHTRVTREPLSSHSRATHEPLSCPPQKRQRTHKTSVKHTNLPFWTFPNPTNTHTNIQHTTQTSSVDGVAEKTGRLKGRGGGFRV